MGTHSQFRGCPLSVLFILASFLLSVSWLSCWRIQSEQFPSFLPNFIAWYTISDQGNSKYESLTRLLIWKLRLLCNIHLISQKCSLNFKYPKTRFCFTPPGFLLISISPFSIISSLYSRSIYQEIILLLFYIPQLK